MGPKPEVKVKQQSIQLPKDLDLYLSESEAIFPDLREGTEKKIIWAETPNFRTEYSIIYLHGFSATRQELAPVPDSVASQIGANLFYTRLTGHGRSGDAMLEASGEAWISDAQEAITIGRKIGKNVIVMATSTGATLAISLALEENWKDVAAYVFISPNFEVRDKTATVVTWPWSKYFVPLIAGKMRIREAFTEAHEKYWTLKYPTTAVIPVMALVKYMRNIDFASISNPTLFIYSKNDKVVDTSYTELAFETFGSPQKQKYVVKSSGDPQNHLIAGDALSPQNNQVITKVIEDYLRQVLEL